MNSNKSNSSQLRFNELSLLLDGFMEEIYKNSEKLMLISKQLNNVLKNCDSITYDELGTAEAYAILHFMDRYHRFQLIFDELHRQGLMPQKNRLINILDVGTGPGPSMFALSDFYTTKLKSIDGNDNYVDSGFKIDYVERSQEFRNWLHHFTEYVNFYNPSKIQWQVPYHHGSFHDFKDIDFNQKFTSFDYNDDGDMVSRNYVHKHRFDLTVFSNFLTTKEQVQSFSEELKNCMRFLRNNGILIIVGAKGESEKYKEVYKEISRILLNENFNNWKFKASCKKIELDSPVLGYSWGDEFGCKLKTIIAKFNEAVISIDNNLIPSSIAKKLKKIINDTYSKPIEWEVNVFKKYARIRDKNKSNET